MADVSLSTLRGELRRKLVTLTASDAAVAVPSWARMAYITGAGGGGSGAVRTSTGQRGGGGSSAANVLRLPVVIVSGTSTLAVTIGAGGTGPSATAQTDGADGGATSVTIGAYFNLSIGGGKAGLGTGGGGATAGVTALVNQQANTSTSSAILPIMSGKFDAAQVYLLGASTGGAGGSDVNGYGAGGSSLFGIGGAGVSAAPSANTAGANGTGYGSGGAGALWLSGAAAKAGNGANGFVQIEFVEGT